jgi:hypothetical protein
VSLDEGVEIGLVCDVWSSLFCLVLRDTLVAGPLLACELSFLEKPLPKSTLRKNPARSLGCAGAVLAAELLCDASLDFSYATCGAGAESRLSGGIAGAASSMFVGARPAELLTERLMLRFRS